jgi:hypothetical protein
MRYAQNRNIPYPKYLGTRKPKSVKVTYARGRRTLASIIIT